MNTQISILTVLIASAFTAVTALAQTTDFYAGKTISLIIGSGEAGGYDMGGRLMARYLKTYIPGNPTILPRNKPGATSVVAAEYLYNVAPRDGLTLGTVQPGIVLNKSLDPKAKYLPERFSWIGRIQPATLIGIGWTAAGLNTLEDAQKREFAVSASGAAGLAAIVPWALNKMAGTRLKVIRGYESVRPQFVAMERGEVMGIGSVSLADALARPEWLRDHLMSLLYTIALKRVKYAPDTPAIVELASGPLDREVMAMLGSSTDIGQMLMAPPDVPGDRVAILRKAFDAMIADPDFVEEAEKLGIFVEPLKGAELTAMVSAASAASPEALARLREVAQPPD